MIKQLFLIINNSKKSMKKYIVFCAGMCLALTFASCKSGESAYKKAYEKAKSQEASMQANEPTTAPAPVVTTTPSTQSNVAVDNATVRNETVVLIDGNGLKNFSVVIGSFGVLSNAQALCQQLRDNGYEGQIVKNEARNMFRVIASSFDKKADAVSSRDAIRGSQFNPKGDAWLLYNAQ